MSLQAHSRCGIIWYIISHLQEMSSVSYSVVKHEKLKALVRKGTEKVRFSNESRTFSLFEYSSIGSFYCIKNIQIFILEARISYHEEKWINNLLKL